MMTEPFIIPAHVLRDVRMAAIGDLQAAADDLYRADPERSVRTFVAACDKVRDVQELVGALGLDLNANPVDLEMPAEWIQRVGQVARHADGVLRYHLAESLPDDIEELRVAVERLAVLNDLAEMGAEAAASQ